MPRPARPCVDGPDPCPCRVHQAQISSARRYRARKGRPAQYNKWFPRHDALLLERLDAGDSPEEIAHALTETFTVPRSANAVKLRITRLGRSLVSGWATRAEVSRRLGLPLEALARLDASGALPSTPYGTWIRYRLADVEAFVKAQAGLLIDPKRVRDPHWKALAETAAIVNRRRQSA